MIKGYNNSSVQTNANLWQGFLLIFFSLLPSLTAASGWQTLSPGLEYQDLDLGITPWSHAHVFRVDLHSHPIDLLSAKSIGLNYATAQQFVEQGHALMSMNGGFFDEAFKPLGLRVAKQQITNPLKKISWWGIFYIQNNSAHIRNIYRFKYQKDIDFAIQAGPRLLIKGKIPSLKPGLAERTALGITAEGKVILLVTSHAAMSTTRLAYLMKSPPLSCTDALNLDGGSSSQMYAKIGSFELNVLGFAQVSDAVILK